MNRGVGGVGDTP